MMRILLALMLILVSLFSVAQAQEVVSPDFTAGLRPDYTTDLERYPEIPLYDFDLEITPDFDQTTLIGTGSIRYTNTTPDVLTNLVLRLYPNLDSFGGEVLLENVMVNELAVEPALDETGSIMFIDLQGPLDPGAAVTLTFDYSGVVFHGEQDLYNQFSYLETELALASLLPLLSVYEPGAGWWQEIAHPQGDAVYSEIGNFDVTLTYPAYLKVVASGSIITEETSTDGEFMTTRYVAPLMRDFSIMASPEYETLSGSFKDVRLNIHYLPGHEDAAEAVLGWTVDAFEAYSAYFGSYVYNELDVVETHTAAGGIEYPGLIVVASDFWDPDEFYLQIITVHEVAHQWWYSMVGNDQVNYPWLDEALTDYSVAQYFRYLHGSQGYQSAIQNYVEQFTSYEENAGEELIGQTTSDYSEQAYGPIVYRKGAYFFHILSETIGMEALIEGLQLYLESYRYDTATPFDLQTVLETTSGMELDELFLEWIGYSN